MFLHPSDLSPNDKSFLLKTARRVLDTIKTGEKFHSPSINTYENMTRIAATFITLEKQNELRGCIGNLAPVQSVLDDVIENTLVAATRDPRFSPVVAHEVDEIIIKISVLSPLKDINMNSEAQLIDGLIPFHDGLVIREGFRKSTFLPSVWYMVKDSREFVTHLKQKAGFPSAYWSKKIRCQKYFTVEFSE